MRASSSRRMVVAAMVALVTGAGCGLMDLASFNGVKFALPVRTYTFSANDVGAKAPQGAVPNVMCGPGTLVTNCCMPPAGVPAGSINCTMYPLSCEGGTCAAKVLVERVSPINLAAEVPELKQVKGNIIGEIFLKHLDITVNNASNVALPDVDIYVGPDSASSATSPGTHLIAKIPGKPPGYNMGERIELSAEAQQAFSNFAKDIKTPFKIIMSTTYIVTGGSAAPQGMVTVGVGGQVEAKL